MRLLSVPLLLGSMPLKKGVWAESYAKSGIEYMTPESVERLLYYLELAGEDTSEFDHLKSEIKKFGPAFGGQGV